MTKAIILLLTFILSISAAHSQSETEINRWISEADAFRSEKKYEQAATLYKKVLLLRPDFGYVSEKLDEMEDHIIYNRILEELDVKYDSERYLQRFGSKGLYYNQVRQILHAKYEEQAIRVAGEVTKLIELYMLYEMNLSARSDLLSAEIALSARDSAKKAAEIKDWPKVVHYDEIALNYERNQALQNISQARMEHARKKIGRGIYTSVGYVYNPQMPLGLFASRLKKDKIGWYIAMQLNGNFFNNFSSENNFSVADFAPDIPQRDILFVSDESRGLGSITLGANYPIYKSLYAMAGLGVLHVSNWKDVEVYRRDEDFGSGLYQGRVQSGGGFSEASVFIVPEIGLEYKFWRNASIQYRLMITNQLTSGMHNFGIAYGLTH